MLGIGGADTRVLDGTVDGDDPLDERAMGFVAVHFPENGIGYNPL